MRSFTTKLTLRLALLVTITTAGAFSIGGWLLHKQMIDSIELLHEGECRELGTMIGTDPDLNMEDVTQRIGQDVASDGSLYFIQVHNARGTVLFRSPNLGEAVLPDLTGFERHRTTELPGVGPVRITESQQGPWHIQVASPLVPMQRLMRDYVRVSVGLVLGVAAVGIGLGYGFSRITLNPVRAIERTARRISGDNLSERIPVPSGKDELTSLTELLNFTFDRLEVSFNQIRRFTADASHELKTPLALVRLNAEKLRPFLAENSEASATLSDLLEEIAGLHRIIESLLFLSRTEGSVLSTATGTIEVTALVRDFGEDAQALAEDRGMKFTITRADAGEIRGEATLLRQLLLNLLVNSFAVMADGGTVSLSVERQAERWSISMTDEGPGLPEDQLARVFERFARYNHTSDRSGQERGHGLGLAICKAIAGFHGGTIRAENRTDRPGLRVTVTLPAA